MASSLSQNQEPEKRGVYDLSKAFSLLTLRLKDPWKSQAQLFEPLHPDAESILRQVQIPSTVKGRRRIKDYIRSISITPKGEAFAPQCTMVWPDRMWVADHFSGTDPSNIESLGITHIVCIGHDQYHLACPQLPTVVHVPVVVPSDIFTNPLVAIIDDTITLITKLRTEYPDHRILLHCAMGMDWSPIMVMACIMRATGCSFRSAQLELERARETTLPGPILEGAVQQWWNLEHMRPDFPIGRGQREFRWAVAKDSEEDKEKTEGDKQESKADEEESEAGEEESEADEEESETDEEESEADEEESSDYSDRPRGNSPETDSPPQDEPPTEE